MKALDRLLQRWRIRKALPFVRRGDRLLDVGCHDRVLLDAVRGRAARATGVDGVVEPIDDGDVRLLRGTFPDDFDFDDESFDCVTALAVVEHVEEPAAFAQACERLLAPAGRLVVTVPHPVVDRILDALIALRLLDGMAHEEHHGFDVARTIPLFEETGLRLRTDRRFQLGLNRLFVFEKPDGAGQSRGGVPRVVSSRSSDSPAAT